MTVAELQALKREGRKIVAVVAWDEGTAWNRGGTFAWRMTNRTGVELASTLNAGPVPVWGLVSSVALKDASFVVFR